MLGIGFKVSDTASVSVQRPLGEFLRREYAGGADADGEAAGLSAAQEAALAQFAQLKADVDLVRAPSTVARHVLLRYYAQLERMAQRFEPTRGATGAGNGGAGSADGGLQRLRFSWFDSFCPRKKSTQSGLAFERAAVLFNLGALESQLGVHTDRATAEGLKAACRHFMLAAGAFAHVRDELAPRMQGARTPDMSAEGLRLLATLMLAQAQACFYEKAIKDGMTDGVKAKLAHQALDFYASALARSDAPALAGTIDRSWGEHLRFQARCMRAATQYWQARAAKVAALARGEGYGEEIARLAASDAACEEAVALATQSKLPAPLVQSAQALQRVVRERLAAARKDNASVYLDKVPRLADLPPVGKAAMVRPLALTSAELTEALGGADLFEQFVPRALLQRAEAVKRELEALLRASGERAAESNAAVKQRLAALGLPASIEAFERSGGVPASVWQRVQHVQAAAAAAAGGGADESFVAACLRARLGENEAAADAAECSLRAVDARLGEEEVGDNVSRQNYGADRWARPTSAALSGGFRADVDRYFRLVREARQSDEVVRGKLAGSEALLALLARSKPALDAEMPALAQEQSSCRDEIGALSALLLRLGQLVEEKEQLLRDFEASVGKFDALPLLLGNGNGSNGGQSPADDAEAALRAEEQFFREHFEGKLGVICEEEQAALESLAAANEAFEARKQHDPVLLARQSLLQRLSDGVDVFEQLESHLKEGRRFYDELAVRIVQLRQTVDDHCSARELEKRELELGLKADADAREREARDAELARKMMSDLQLSGRGPEAEAYARGGDPGDEALARQLAGSTPQQYQPPPAGFDYAQLPPPPQPPQQQQWAPQQQQQWGPPPASAYGAYQQARFNGGGGGGSAGFPSASAYGNYYAQQQQMQTQTHPQQPQPPLPGGRAFSQYPGQAPPPAPRDSV